MSKINPMARVIAERTIAASQEEVFDFVTDSDNLRAASLVRRVKRTREGANSGWSAGAVREVTAIGAWFRKEITAVDRPHTFSYQILKSVPPIEHFGGTIEVTPVQGGSHVVWQSAVDIPLAAGGKITAQLAKKVLELTFGQILAAADRKLSDQ